MTLPALPRIYVPDEGDDGSEDGNDIALMDAPDSKYFVMVKLRAAPVLGWKRTMGRRSRTMPTQASEPYLSEIKANLADEPNRAG